MILMQGKGVSKGIVKGPVYFAHTSRNKIIFDVGANKVSLFLPVKLNGQCNVNFSGKLSVAGFLIQFNAVPERGAV